MNNFYLDYYTDLDDLYDANGVTENDWEPYYPDGVDEDDYTVTGCDPIEFDDIPF